MAIIVWGDTYGVGVKDLDEQHRNLAERIGDLHKALRAGKNQAVTSPKLKSLIDSFSEHFAAEERYMLLFDYPDYMAHKARHDRFTRQVADFHDRLRVEAALLSMEFLEFLSDWFTTHIIEFDRQYGPLFREKGLP